MKSTNINRKRRWDQPPEEISGPPTVKKLCISENETFPVNETESLETASPVSPNVDRINSQCDNISGVSNQSTHATLAENEEISIELTRSHSSDISSEASAMSIDLPEDNSDKCETPLCEPSSDIKSCSDSNENSSEVNVLESCDRLQCVGTVDHPTNDSRFIASDVTLNKETSSATVRETKTVKHELKSNASATVISHQSDELRRIMFSYDEGSSDSDTMESSKEDNVDESISSSKTDENVISVRPSNITPSGNNIPPTGLETSDAASERISFKHTDMSENDISHVSPISIGDKTLSIQPELNSKETDAFIESSNSLENVGGNKGSLIESQLNIPNESEVVESTTDMEIKYDSLANKILNTNQDSIHNEDAIENPPQEVTPVQNLRHLEPANQNLSEDSTLNKTDLIDRQSSKGIKNDQLVESIKDVSTNNDLIVEINLDHKSEVDNVSMELSSKEVSVEDRRTNFDDKIQDKHLTNEVSKNNNEEAIEKLSEQSEEHDNGQLELENPSKNISQFEPKSIQIENEDSNISDDKMEIITSIENYVSSSADIFGNKNSAETDDIVKSKEFISKVEIASDEIFVLSPESTNQNHNLLLSEELEKVKALTNEVVKVSLINETLNLDKSSMHNIPEETVEDELENIIRSEDSQNDITAVKKSDLKSSLLKFQSYTEDVSLNRSDITISNKVQENDQSSETNEQKVTDSLIEEVDISMDVTPSENIDPAVMEVILGSSEGTATIKEVDLKDSVSEHPESVSASIDFEEKMEIVNEIGISQSEHEKNVSDSELESTANNIKSDGVNIEISLENDMLIDSDTKLIGDDKDDSVSVAEVKEVNSPNSATAVENAIEINKSSNVIENDIGSDHCPGTDNNTELEIIEKSDTEQTSDATISRMDPCKKIEEISVSDNTADLTTSPVEVTGTGLKVAEVNELDSKTDKINEIECNTTDITEDNNTEINALDVDQTELKSIENNDIEISTEEPIETEISIEENVESELCSLENEEIVTVESNINTSNDIEDVNMGSSSVESIENCDNENIVTGTNEVVNSRNEVDVEEESKTENLSENPIETEINVGAISPSRRTIDQELKVLEDVSESSEIRNVSDSTRDILKELVIQEEIAMDEDSAIEECVYDNDNIAVREDDIVLTSVDSPPYEDALSNSPEESKIFEKSIDVSDAIGDEMSIDSNAITEPVDESRTIDEEMDSSKVEPSVQISSELPYVEESILPDDSKTLADDLEESFVVEEVVTCESPGSSKDADNDFVSVNEDMSSPLIVFEETCETTESFVNNEVNAVIKENTVDSETSEIDNQNEISNDSNLDFKKYDNANIEKSVQKHISISDDITNEPSVNSIRPDSPLLEMECESSVNSIIKTDSDVEMDLIETPSIEKSSIGLKLDSIKADKHPQDLKDIGINVPLLTTVNNSTVLIKDKPTTTSVLDVNRSGSIAGIDPKLEPITLRIYKDNLSVRTDDLDSPKKNKSPKLSSELKSQLSPHIKSSDSRSSLSPTTKKLEFTLKIAKDVNTNIPRATMSPKSSVSPSGMHKPGDILRAELTSESGRNSPAYLSPESKVKLKIQKPGLSKDYISHIQSGIKEETAKKEDIVDHSGISLPKPPIEIGNVFKKMMESEKSVDPKPEMNADHSSSSPLMGTPISIPVVRKRGRPRKILQKVLPGADPNFNSSLTPGHTPGTPFNHTPGGSPGLDGSGGLDSSESSRMVRSCRARTKPIVVKTRKPRGGGARGGMRGRGAISSGIGGLVRNIAAEMDPEKLAAKLSEREKAELAKIEERKERQRQERHAKNEAKKAKKLARKLKDEERRLKKLREKAEKAEAAAPQVFEEETRMSAPDGGSRGHTPAPASALSRLNQGAVFAGLKQDKSKGEPREQALEAVAMWNSNLNRERREDRRCALDLQTFTVHYPKQVRERMVRPVPKAGLYPVSLIPGQFSDSYKVYTPTELMYFPLNTVMYGPLKPNERQPINPSDGSGSDSSSSSTSEDSSSSSSECESEDESGAARECKICNGEKKTNKESHPEILLQCSNCKGLCHPTCQEITPEMLPHIRKYTWHCSNCKKCTTCKNTTKDDKMLFCDLCDRGYHIHCVGLKKAPEGRWHCSVCSFCTVCGSKDPGGPEWNYEYKKTDKGVRLYQRTLCVPCSKNALM